MSEEGKEAIEELKRLIELRKNKCGKITYDTCIVSTAQLETLIAELEKKDKIINEMTDELVCEEFDRCCSECTHECEKDYNQLFTCIKQYFEKQIQEKN